MSWIDDLITIGFVQVGVGGDASAQYPIASIACTESTTGPEGDDRTSYIRRRWTIRAWAQAANLNARQTLRQTLESTLARRGKLVTVQLGSGARTLPAPGAGGSLLGYPAVEISDVVEDTFGTVLGFTLTAETMIPVVDGSGIVEHTFETEESIDSRGLTTLTVSGTIRLAPGEDAKAWAITNVLDPAESAAGTANRGFQRRTRVGLDASVCEYSYSSSDTGAGTNGVSKADVSDVTTRDSVGRRTRTISGSAEGSAATTFAASLEPVPGATELLTQKRISQPSTPDGRVTFSYELLSGVQPGGRFGTLVVFSHDESIDDTSEGRPIQVTPFLGADPVLSRGLQAPFVYEQSSSIEFTGGDFGDGESALTGLMDDDNLARRPRVRTQISRHGVRRLTITRRYIYATAQTVPEPRELPALEDWP